MYDPKMKNYLAPISYLISHYIYEYDISKANLNIMYNKGVISKDEYNFIKTFPRQQRQIYFGMCQKDPEKAKILNEGLTEFRKKFIESNNITDVNLLSVKNDAIFIIDKIPTITSFDNITFVKKNVYTSFYKLGKLEVYYYFNPIDNNEVIDVKGIDDDILLYHKDNFIDLLCTIFYSIQTDIPENSLSLINNIINNYINRKYPLEIYREFNSDSLFRISMPNGLQYLFYTVDKSNIEYLNITTNLNILRDLYGIISSIYFNNKRK